MTAAQVAVLIREFQQQRQLPSAFARLAEMLLKMEDKGANHARQLSIACATAAENDDKQTLAVLNAVSAYILTATTTVTPRYSGTITQAFGGAANEFHNVGPIAATWVTAASVINVVYTSGCPSPPPTFATEQFRAVVRNIVPGTSFDVMLNNPGAPPAANYNWSWFSFG